MQPAAPGGTPQLGLWCVCVCVWQVPLSPERCYPGASRGQSSRSLRCAAARAPQHAARAASDGAATRCSPHRQRPAREHRLRHQLKLAGNSRLNQLAELLLRPGALETLFKGVAVRPSVLHGAWWEGGSRAESAGRVAWGQSLVQRSAAHPPQLDQAGGTRAQLASGRAACRRPRRLCSPATTADAHPPAGDLWSGNIAAADGQPCIFDPATYYGHHEAEWGMR